MAKASARLKSLGAPFLKWAGGKARLLPQYRPFFPSAFHRYFEPFVGGGAVFFDLMRQGSLGKGAFLSDANPDLVNVYQVVKGDVEGLLKELTRGPYVYDPEIYYEIRAWNTSRLSRRKRAARLIFLNHTCFNGLYRTNGKGQFNVPFGRFRNPQIVDPPLLRAVSAVLAGVEISCLPFEAVIERARRGDLVYFDPPYVPLSRTASFTSYAKGAFGEGDQRRLADVFGRLDRRGVLVRLSNSDTPLARELYAAFPRSSISAARAINSKGAGRGHVTELLVRGHDREGT